LKHIIAIVSHGVVRVEVMLVVVMQIRCRIIAVAVRLVSLRKLPLQKQGYSVLCPLNSLLQQVCRLIFVALQRYERTRS
jgi:hypothetical protein